MNNFSYWNPTRIHFGKGAIAELRNRVPESAHVFLIYGGGSIKSNGVYEQVVSALRPRAITEFGGIEPNPKYETCMKAVETGKFAGVDFLLAVGGGSVLDATKFISAAMRYSGQDPWEILAASAPVTSALPLGCVMTLPATGSEMNSFAVISREGTRDKRHFSSDWVRPLFSILDPETTFSLSSRQTANGIVDAWVHVCEQYLTYPADARLQDRQAEAILLTLLELGPKVLKRPTDYEIRAQLMWCATQALNELIACGVPQDWSTHMIGHELTALYGIDHGQSLAVALPGVLHFQREKKRKKLSQYAERIWGLSGRGKTAEEAIGLTEDFFKSLGVNTRLSDYGIPASVCEEIGKRFSSRGVHLGEHRDLGGSEVAEILKSRL